jgi:predicted transcriptional regulator
MPVQESSSKIRIISAFADETRIDILNLLIKYPDICVSSMASELNLSVSAISQQCKLLELSDVIIRSRNGQKICYKINTRNHTVNNLVNIIKEDNL